MANKSRRVELSVADVRTPVTDGLEPPASKAPSTLPFRARTWPDFERILLQYAEHVDGLRSARIYGVPGQAQHGIDLYGTDSHGKSLRKPLATDLAWSSQNSTNWQSPIQRRPGRSGLAGRARRQLQPVVRRRSGYGRTRHRRNNGQALDARPGGPIDRRHRPVRQPEAARPAPRRPRSPDPNGSPDAAPRCRRGPWCRLSPGVARPAPPRHPTFPRRPHRRTDPHRRASRAAAGGVRPRRRTQSPGHPTERCGNTAGRGGQHRGPR